MFDQTFVDIADQSARKPLAVVGSVLVQTGIVCVLILIPLLYTQALPNAQLLIMLTAPMPPTIPVPPDVISKKAPNVRRTLQVARLVAPAAIPKTISRIADAAPAPDLGVYSGNPSRGPASAVLYGSVGTDTTVAPPPPAAVKKPEKPVAVGGNVAAANLIHRMDPVYPALAKSARVQVTVQFTAIISKEGRVEHLQLISGHSLLVRAARCDFAVAISADDARWEAGGSHYCDHGKFPARHVRIGT